MIIPKDPQPQSKVHRNRCRIKRTPASTPLRLKKSIRAKPIKGPPTILTNEFIIDNFRENTLSLVRATPNDIKTIKIVAYEIKKVVFSKNKGTSKSK